MKNKKYNILLSLIVLFIFLGLLFIRMAWKFDFNLNGEVLNITEEIQEISDEYVNSKITGEVFLTSINAKKSVLINIYNNNLDSRSDYIYLVDDLIDDVNTIIENYQNNDDNTINNIKYISKNIGAYKTQAIVFLVLGIIFTISGTTILIYDLVSKSKRKNLVE